jgi:multicomponent Na+:H+ antiporter subunit C
MTLEVPILLLAGSLLASGIYLVLDRTLLRVVIGLGLLSNGTHLLLLSTAGLEAGAAPVLDGSHVPVVDPLPQALILTAIVISFGVTALLLTIAYGTVASYSSDDLAELHGRLHDE